VVAEGLDVAEDVVPAAAVQPHNVLPERVQNFVHLERGQNVLDQHRGFDGSHGNLQLKYTLQFYVLILVSDETWGKFNYELFKMPLNDILFKLFFNMD